MKQPYIKIVNTDGLPYDLFFWAYLESFNRKAAEVHNWTTTTIIGLPNTADYGFKVPLAGQYTAFRKRKINGVTDYINVEVNACDGTIDNSSITFFTDRITPPSDNFNFTIAIRALDLGGHILSDFEYGFALNENDTITNWQDLYYFNLMNEGVYFFNMRVKGQATAIGKQTVELYINQDIGNFGGGDESDNTMPGTGSSEG